MNFSKLDSDRFQLNIFRDNYEQLPADLLNQLIENKVDIGILRLNTKEQATLNLLDNMGLPFIVADTLVEYIAKTSAPKELKLLNKDIEVLEAHTEADWKEVDRMVELCFSNYSNHYFSNPYLSKIGNIEGYKEWSRNCSGDKGVTYIVKSNSVAAGFFSIGFKGDLADGGPGGIIPAFEGSGLYLDFHKMLPQLIFQKGLKKLKTSTQIQNTLVQRQWNMSGWMLSHSWVTLHVNTFIQEAMKGSNTSSNYQHSNTISFIDSIHSLHSYNTVQMHQLHPLKEGFSYNVFVSNEIKNYNNNSSIRSLIIEDTDHVVQALAWLKS